VPQKYDPPWAWRYEAKCSGEDTEMFFPPRDKDLYRPIADKAKAICWGKDGRPPCPVRKECLKEAILNEELHGIFGGLSHRERNAAQRKMKKHNLTLDEWLNMEGKYVKTDDDTEQGSKSLS
jgi:WhiB family redox-sensing transcriptional regulator